ncbi:hypothetical protein [Amycolatopsis echigonensis]|uniref:Uncharacterized protein n=1 Tax=Amycolatopsis echigonensis TaxID=2576905 RepID=A0A8E1W9F6_9PSEU|nr:hypothetical protein [Amycolatopsis echigonensis]MBB2506008.1 hypothetical protein [Amycolatopsis echigonensis]
MSGELRTPTEQGRALLDGPIPKGSEAEVAACVRRVKLESRNSAEATEILQMLGLVDQDFEWVATSRNHRKRVQR